MELWRPFWGEITCLFWLEWVTFRFLGFKKYKRTNTNFSRCKILSNDWLRYRLVYRISSCKALPRKIPAILEILAFLIILWSENIVFSNKTRIWRLCEIIIPASLIWGNTVVQKVYEWPGCYFAKMILWWGNHFGQRTAWTMPNLIYRTSATITRSRLETALEY